MVPWDGLRSVIVAFPYLLFQTFVDKIWYYVPRHLSITYMYAIRTNVPSCADPETFVRGGPTLTTFLFFIVDERREDQIKWRFAVRPIMAQH